MGIGFAFSLENISRLMDILSLGYYVDKLSSNCLVIVLEFENISNKFYLIFQPETQKNRREKKASESTWHDNNSQ